MGRQAVHEFAKISPAHADLYDGVGKYLARRNYSPRTIETYLHEIKVFLAWIGNRHPKTVSLSNLRDYQNYLAHEHTGRNHKLLALSSQSRNLTAVRVFFRYLKRENLIITNPADKLILPKVGKRKRKNTLVLSDVRKMTEYPAHDAGAIRDRALVHFLAATGIRATSCANIDIADVDFQRREVLIRISKGNRSYVTFFTNACRIALEEYVRSARPRLLADEDNDSLFVDDKGRRPDRTGIRDIVRRMKERAGIRKHIHPHLFRHWLCTTLLERGANVRAVSEIAGMRGSPPPRLTPKSPPIFWPALLPAPIPRGCHERRYYPLSSVLQNPWPLR